MILSFSLLPALAISPKLALARMNRKGLKKSSGAQ